jgi:hypothetical protein
MYVKTNMVIQPTAMAIEYKKKATKTKSEMAQSGSKKC